MKKVLTHIFITLVNFYFLSFTVGIFLMLVTMVSGPITPQAAIITMFSSFALAVGYQIIRDEFALQSPGELIVSNTSKQQILEQDQPFRITRVPLFLLFLISIIISGNIIDGLSEYQSYSLVSVIFFAIVAVGSFMGMQSFVRKPEILPIGLLMLVQLLVGFTYKYSVDAPLTGDGMFKFYLILSCLWLVTGLIYIQKSNNNQPHSKEEDNEVTKHSTATPSD